MHLKVFLEFGISGEVMRLVLHHRTFSLPSAHEFFDEAGELNDPHQNETLDLVIEGAVALAGQVSGKG